MNYFLLSFIIAFVLPQDEADDTIKRLNKQMEEAFNAGELQKVAGFYLDDAYLISPGDKTITTRANIDESWTSIKNPVKWELEVIEVTKDEKSIYDNEYWKALKNKPPEWRAQGIDIDNNQQLVYQLGHSKLTTMRDGKENTSEVDFILIWKYTDEGYKILLDTYTWQ
ncbi:DUF4440 domain-containing protein [Fulvivirga ulvae]|uniref:YybH family protein n=1 Tax=Fulvivirga ulvae TaxID=2904245 RepID=UPI001F264336|nr:DUF4440 domain-containing protein [Fulvivirga ulvae]UII32364.1 DUF4440 domain-containing protein [Fulvivirga ulvae]